MNQVTGLFAQRGGNGAIDNWLGQNPLVLGLLALALGALIIVSGVYTLRTGVTRNKLGMEARGVTAQLAGYIRIVGGGVACGYGLYKILMG